MVSIPLLQVLVILDLKKRIMVQVSSNPTGFQCITNIPDKAMREQMEAMMGGYSIERHLGYPNYTYSGPAKSLDWFCSIFRMYGFKIEVFVPAV